MNWRENLNPVLIARVERFIALAARQGYRVSVVSGKRSTAQQARLYARYKAGQSRLPAAPPGRSKHEQGNAVDVSINGNASSSVPWSTWQKVGAIGQQAGLRWLGQYDRVHFELPDARGAQTTAAMPFKLIFAGIGVVLALALVLGSKAE